MLNIQKYLEDKDVKKIRIGQSGADVYEINGESILKYVKRERVENGMFDTYMREALFYESEINRGKKYLPDIEELELSYDEIIILMKKYNQPKRDDIDEGMIKKVMDVLAHIHADDVPKFMENDGEMINGLKADEIESYLNGWKSVLDEHKGAFADDALDDIAENINRIILWHNLEESVLIHGDFHFENLLLDDDGNIVVCDWQSVKRGKPSTDISLFMSRLSADGVDIEPLKILDVYADSMEKISGKKIDGEDILKHISAENIITSFIFWHNFLHGNDEQRVRGVYEKMIEDYKKFR